MITLLFFLIIKVSVLYCTCLGIGYAGEYKHFCQNYLSGHILLVSYMQRFLSLSFGELQISYQSFLGEFNARIVAFH